MLARDLMTRGVECAGPDEKLRQVAVRMRDMDVGSFPVCESGRLTGMITDRDIAIRCVAEGADPNKASVRDAMTDELVFCFEEQTADEVSHLMRQRQVRRLPVLDADKNLIGIIAVADLALEGTDDQTAEAVEGISRPK
jgi:CBS domain-containing protein